LFFEGVGVAISGLEMADLVREVCYDGGDGPLLLGGAVAGYRAFADVLGAGARFPYMIMGVGDPTQWEAGTGELDEAGRLVRTPAASSAGGAAVDFAPLEKKVGLALHAGWVAAVEAHGHGLAAIDGLAAALDGKQGASANLTALAGQASAADQMSYWTGAGAAGLTALSAQGRSLIGAGDAAAARAAIGLGGLATQSPGAVAISGGTIGGIVDLAVADGGTGASSASVARSNLGLAIGSDVQAYDADLEAIAALATTSFGRALLTRADAAGVRSYIGAGTSSTSGTVTSVAMSGGTTGLSVSGGPVTGSGTLTLGGTLALASGGTGATSASGARSALGLGDMAVQAASAVAISGGAVAGLTSLQVSHPSSTAFSYIDSLAGQYALLRWRSGTAGRWDMGKTNGAESGSNAGADFALRRFSDAGSVLGTALTIRRDTGEFQVGGVLAPASDNSLALGGAALRWSIVYAGSGTISTSDAREKQEMEAVDPALIEAWGDVRWVRYRFRAAVAEKGDAARWHVGLVAQQVRDAIDARMGDGAAQRWGLLCHDAWDAQAEARDDEGVVVRPARAAGERWGLRYEECLALEAAWQRHAIAALADRVAALEAGHAG
jgi:hypothetical protein